MTTFATVGDIRKRVAGRSRPAPRGLFSGVSLVANVDMSQVSDHRPSTADHDMAGEPNEKAG